MGFTMVMITAARCAAALAAGALLVWAPMAHADDPVDTDTAQQDENQQPGDNQGDQGPGIAKDVVDKVGDAAKDLTKQQGRPNQQLTGKMMAELVEYCEGGADHDAVPLQFTLPYTGVEIDVGFYSRKRAINEQSSFSVLG